MVRRSQRLHPLRTTRSRQQHHSRRWTTISSHPNWSFEGRRRVEHRSDGCQLRRTQTSDALCRLCEGSFEHILESLEHQGSQESEALVSRAELTSLKDQFWSWTVSTGAHEDLDNHLQSEPRTLEYLRRTLTKLEE